LLSDARAALPYLQVAAILRGRIESGELAPKARLPSIVGLVQEYGIARTTAAKALKMLVDEGLVGAGRGDRRLCAGRPGSVDCRWLRAA
jgi:DNA-binding GntR family transcriptional regulator